MRLVIVESPIKAEKIAGLYPDVTCVATAGHICDLPINPKTGIGINRETLLGEYALTEDKNRGIDGMRVVNRLRTIIEANPEVEVYLATELDREGESIAAFVVKYLHLRRFYRIAATAITKEAFDKAFASPQAIDWYRVNSRECRRLADRIIAYTCSPILRRVLGQQGVSVGRVQAAAEALIVERERQIRGHQSQTYYTVEYDMGGWIAQWKLSSEPKPKRSGPRSNGDYAIYDLKPRCIERATAAAAAGFKGLQVTQCDEAPETQLPPPPLDTLSMIQVANQLLDWSAEKTMQTAQRLYEGDSAGHGHITYYRTQLQSLDTAAAEKLRDWLRSQGLPVSTVRNEWPPKSQFAKEGQEAIRPTYIEVEEAGADADQRALYKLIRDRALYSQLAPARYFVKRIELTDPLRGNYVFTATAWTLVNAGWKATPSANTFGLPDCGKDGDVQAYNAVALPTLARGTLIKPLQATIKSHTTLEPPRYTIRTLIDALKVLGIGRPATITTIMKALERSGHLAKDGTVQPTPLLERIYDVLYPRFAFAHIGYAAELELALDKVASGQLDGMELIRNVWKQLDIDCAMLMGHVAAR